MTRATPPSPRLFVRRRLALAPLLCACAPRLAFGTGADAGLRWAREAEAMRQLALSWGDQAYGAVLVRDGRVIGHGPSRVVKNGNPDAHAEREAIRDALTRVGADPVRGADLYATSRPCALCEAAAARAGVRRMFFGAQAQDAGAPRLP
jgi:tRNA(Arg) A34 adenosine deaminase TadA